MKKIILAALLFHWLTIATAQQHYSKVVNDQIARVEANLWERMVIDNYQVVWAKGYGYADKKEGKKVTTNTMFEPGSISKSLNAVGILQLAQEGKLDDYFRIAGFDHSVIKKASEILSL